MVRLPRLVIAAAASSAGKTTIATGLMGALSAAGHRVAGFKVGPDFIDPGYHALATGRPGRNLDPVLTSEALVPALALHGAATPEPADIAIVEGVMGLFDGQLGRDGFGSTAHVARLLDAPVVLVVDAAGSSRTAAAAAVGLRGFDPWIRIGGVIVNRVGSERHASELRAVFADAGLPVLGVVARDAAIETPSRHLGLVPAAERAASAGLIGALADRIAGSVDLDAVVALAESAPDLDAVPWRPEAVVTPVPGRPLVGVLAGRAFTFRYAETAELLAAAGCELIDIDPLADDTLPDGLAGLYIGGGFPEVHAAELAGNARLRGAIADAVAAGLPTVAECAGQLYLADQLDGHAMAGALPATARMTPRLTLGYRQATAPADTLVAAAGTTLTGHEFHRTQTTATAEAQPAWTWLERPAGFSADPAGVGEPTLHASYLHVHWAGHPGCAQRFAEASARFVGRTGGVRSRDGEAPAADGVDLRHHGDRDLTPGLVDLAVNVALPGPPPWLAREIEATTATLGSYPDASAARSAIAEAHGVPPEMVLPTAGAAEAFTLIAQVLRAKNPLVVHPQFTAPEAALRAAGHAVQRWILPLGGGVPRLDDLPAWADAVFVGNPTNPTGWLHSVADLDAAGRGRLLIVDEAFMDAAGEAESLIGPLMHDRLVVRSVSKTWGLAGLRVGYVVGDPAWIARLAERQPPWPVSAPAAAALVAVCGARAREEAAARYQELAGWRASFVAALANAGFSCLPSAAPFVLVDTSACGPGSVRRALASAGFAVRRGETFPGLGPTWIRVRVPDPSVAEAFVAALRGLRREPEATVNGPAGADGSGAPPPPADAEPTAPTRPSASGGARHLPTEPRSAR